MCAAVAISARFAARQGTLPSPSAPHFLPLRSPLRSFVRFWLRKHVSPSNLNPNTRASNADGKSVTQADRSIGRSLLRIDVALLSAAASSDFPAIGHIQPGGVEHAERVGYSNSGLTDEISFCER